VNIIEIASIFPHGNASSLEIIPVGGWQAVTRKGQFKIGDKAVYIEPDYMVPTAHPAFSFLAKEGRDCHRLKAIRLRGILSYGLLIPVPAEITDLPIGADVMDRLGIERYEPPHNIKTESDDGLPKADWPSLYAPKFDVESLQRYPELLISDESVIVTEKIHGASARYVVSDDVFFMGSRTRWLKPDRPHPWSIAARTTPSIETWCRANPGTVIYGEVYGAVQSLQYGCDRAEVRFAAFAILNHDEWRVPSADDNIPQCPVLYRGPFDMNLVKHLAEEDSTLGGPGHMREGLVIVPSIERRHELIGRVALKYISDRYWESKN